MRKYMEDCIHLKACKRLCVEQEPERDGGGDAEWRTIGIVAFVKT